MPISLYHTVIVSVAVIDIGTFYFIDIDIVIGFYFIDIGIVIGIP